MPKKSQSPVFQSVIDEYKSELTKNESINDDLRDRLIKVLEGDTTVSVARLEAAIFPEPSPDLQDDSDSIGKETT